MSIAAAGAADVAKGGQMFSPEDAVLYLLLLLFVKILILGGLCVTLMLFIIRQRRERDRPPVAGNSRSTPADSLSERPFRKLLFTPPRSWLAVKSTNQRLIQHALGLRNATPCTWDDGIYSHEDGQLFLTPPVQGWTLILGNDLTRFGEDADACFHFIRSFSRRIGMVQFFSLNPVVHHHAWVLANQGEILRAYCWAGETLWNQGPLTAAEKHLHMVCHPYGPPPTTSTLESSPDPGHANIEKLHLLAGKWSVDPTAIDSNAWIHQHGTRGRFHPFA